MPITKIETSADLYASVSPISIEIEIPESLHDSITQFTESSDWDYSDVIRVALETFLIQNSICTVIQINDANLKKKSIESVIARIQP